MNNWERNKFESAEKAMLYAIALTMKMVPVVVVSWKGRSWQKEDFDKKVLDSVKEVI